MARAIERQIWVLNRIHGLGVAMTSGGSEGVQAAVAAALRPGVDWIIPGARDLALCLAMGVSPLEVMLSVFGRSADPSSSGRQQPPSFSSRRSRIVTSSGTAGAKVVHAAGIAYASRMRALDEVTIVSIDENDTDSGDWHEGMNFAAVHHLPVVCVVYDNAPHGSAPPRHRRADLVLKRAQGYGVAGESVDGSEFQAGFETLGRAVGRARAGRGPSLVHARTPELASRSPRGSFRGRDELEAESRRDPIETMRVLLSDARLLDDAGDSHVQADCARVVEGAIAHAQASRAPEPAQALDNVFAR